MERGRRREERRRNERGRGKEKERTRKREREKRERERKSNLSLVLAAKSHAYFPRHAPALPHTIMPPKPLQPSASNQRQTPAAMIPQQQRPASGPLRSEIDALRKMVQPVSPFHKVPEKDPRLGPRDRKRQSPLASGSTHTTYNIGFTASILSPSSF